MEIDYAALWDQRQTVGEFGAVLIDAWSARYRSTVPTATDDIVVIDPGNGFQYVFDLAGVLGDEPAPWSPRVIGAWGLSRPVGTPRDSNRMRGHPRPQRRVDDRGHLIACASGGGYDINLVPMDGDLNRGVSPAGRRFRSLERRAAARPGTLFFISLTYDDHSDRPDSFEVGVQDGENLLFDRFSNASATSTPMNLGVLRQAAPLPIDAEVVAGCLDLAKDRDRLFERGWRSGPGGLSRSERCAVAGVTGHVAESVAEILLEGLGWSVLWHFAGPGLHGVDLLFLCPDDAVIAAEVKGTLVPGRIPRLSRGDLAQMSAAWVDKAGNPGMVELGLESQDVYGGVFAVNFADLTWRAALTDDFVNMHPVDGVEGLGAIRSAFEGREELHR